MAMYKEGECPGHTTTRVLSGVAFERRQPVMPLSPEDVEFLELEDYCI